MHSVRKKTGIVGVAVILLVMTTLACSFQDVLGGTPDVEIREVEVTRIVTVEPPGPAIELQGVWFNPSTHDYTTILWEDGEFRVAAIVDTDDGEVMQITSSDWDGTRLRWTYYVPSTTYNVTFTMTSLVGDELNTDWSNDHNASGTRTFERR